MPNMVKKWISENTFIKSVLTLMIGSVFSQVIPILISPVITRLYTPADFGIFALFLSVAQLIAVISSGRYELAVMLPRKDEDSFNILALSIGIAIVVSTLTFIMIYFFSHEISTISGSPDIEGWLILIPVLVLFMGLFQAFNYWVNRKKHYRDLSVSRITQSLITAVINLGYGFLQKGAHGLIWGAIAGQGAGVVVLIKSTLKSGKKNIKNISKFKMLEQARIYKDFPKINSLHAFIDVLQSSAVVFIISAFFTSQIVGFYALTLRVLRTPLNFIGKSVSQVFYQRATETYLSGGDLTKLVKKTVLNLALISLPVFILLVVFAPMIFNVVFGEEWYTAGQFTQILSPWLWLNFIYSPVSQIPLIVNKQSQYLVIGLSYNSIIISIFLFAGYFKMSIFFALYMLAVIMPVFLGGTILWLINISKPATKR